MKDAQSVWSPPFRYESMGAQVWDAQNRLVLDIRGWGYLTGRGAGALGMSDGEAIRVQDDFGERIASLLTREFTQLPAEAGDRLAKEK